MSIWFYLFIIVCIITIILVIKIIVMKNGIKEIEIIRDKNEGIK